MSEKPVLIIGISSFLGVNLLDRIKGTRAIETVSYHLGQETPYEAIQAKRYHCIVYLNPDANHTLIDLRVKDHTPLLAIGSGALVDFKAGRIPDNPYIKEKQYLIEMSSVAIHPGFFIPNASHKDTGRGLHRETLLTLFGQDTIPAAFNLDKAYYMTPVDKLIVMIAKFIETPSLFHGEYPFGSVMPITRRDLLSDVSIGVNAIYATDMIRARDEFGLEVSARECETFGAQARAWVNKITSKG